MEKRESKEAEELSNDAAGEKKQDEAGMKSQERKEAEELA